MSASRGVCCRPTCSSHSPGASIEFGPEYIGASAVSCEVLSAPAERPAPFTLKWAARAS